MLGSAITERKFSTKLGLTLVQRALGLTQRMPSVSRTTSSRSRLTTRPSSLASRSGTSSAIRSIMFSSRASRLVKDEASRTVSSSFSILRPRRSAMPLISGRGVVQSLRGQRLGKVLAAPADGSGGADVGRRGHHGDVPRGGDERPGGGGPGALGGDEGDDGDRRCEDALDHVLHGADEAAGGVDDDDDELAALFLGPLQAALEELGPVGVDGAVDLEDEGPTWGRVLGGDVEGRDETGANQPQVQRESGEAKFSHALPAGPL